MRNLNPIGQTFVTHSRPAHLIVAFAGPGTPEEETLCGDGSPSGSTTVAGYLDGGEFDCAGNPMPVCEACKVKVAHVLDRAHERTTYEHPEADGAEYDRLLAEAVAKMAGGWGWPKRG
jgi:hypothetical protein